jgi:hypothetical protein
MRRLALTLSLLALAPLPALAQATAGAQPIVDTTRKPVYKPYVQAGTATSMTVMWRSPKPTTPTLEIQDADRRKLYEVNGPAGDHHTFRLSNLRPGTRYHYVAHENGKPFAESHFHTSPGPVTKQFRFAVIGDTGSGNLNQFSIARKLIKWAPDFVLHMGDVIYEKGEYEGYGPRYMEPFHQLVANTVVYPTPGNHDYGLGNLNGYTRFFEIPRAKPEDQEKWYTFSHGNAQFFSLDTNQPFAKGTPQYNWLVKELEASKATWKIAYTHYPPYTSGEHGSSMYVRNAWGPLFEKHNVQVVFTGHDHHYERSKPREDFVKDGVPTTYVVSGGGGAWLRTIKPQPFSAFTQATYHFIGVTASDRELTAEVIDKGGFVIDRFKVTR